MRVRETESLVSALKQGLPLSGVCVCVLVRQKD